MSKTNPYTKVVMRAWKDPAFKKKLLDDPKTALKEMGFDIPSGENVKIIEETPKTRTFFLPASPTQVNEMSDRELENLAAAGGTADTSLDPQACQCKYTQRSWKDEKCDTCG